jgi:ubiquinone/menaquinone biosynthesis C-methylase UbiE
MDEYRQKLRHLRYYNCAARFYDELYGEEQNRKIEAALRKLNRVKGVSVLDLGCGTGLLFQRIQAQVEVLVGVDFSRSMLKVLGKSERGTNLADLVAADADYLPLRPDLFDLVFAMTLLQNMPNPTHTLREMRRVARTNALVVITGLRNIFDKQLFLDFLHTAELEILALSSSPALKCHLAICRSLPDHQKRECGLTAGYSPSVRKNLSGPRSLH